MRKERNATCKWVVTRPLSETIALTTPRSLMQRSSRQLEESQEDGDALLCRLDG